jgi:hypothetical protein
MLKNNCGQQQLYTMAWVWAEMEGSVLFANFTIEKLTKVLIFTPLCIARPLPNIENGVRLQKQRKTDK